MRVTTISLSERSLPCGPDSALLRLLAGLLQFDRRLGDLDLGLVGGDLGGALKSFRKAMDSDDTGDGADESDGSDQEQQRQIEEGAQPDAEFEEQKDRAESS